MPKGRPENLINSMDFSPEERRERAKKANKASVAARKEKSKIRKAMQVILDGKYEIDGELMKGHEAVAAKIFQEAINPNSKNWAKATDYILQMANAMKSDEDMEMIRAQIDLVRARAKAMEGGDTTAIGVLDAILSGIKQAAETQQGVKADIDDKSDADEEDEE